MGLKFQCGRALMFHGWWWWWGVKRGSFSTGEKKKKKSPQVAELFLTEGDMCNHP